MPKREYAGLGTGCPEQLSGDPREEGNSGASPARSQCTYSCIHSRLYSLQMYMLEGQSDGGCILCTSLSLDPTRTVQSIKVL